jgi:DNA-binding GntR family transcriptional regulator
MNAAPSEPLYTGLQSTSDVAYREIKSLILMGEVPLSVQLGEQRIAERLSMSRTPVREALLRLFAERFLERHPDGGYRVKHPTGRSTRELYELRKALELYAIGLTVSRLGAGELPEPVRVALAELRLEWVGLEADSVEVDPDFVLVDEDFHRRLAEATGNSELVENLRRVCERIRPVRTHDFVLPGRIGTTIAQHLEILDAVLEASPNAVDMLARHISESQEFVESAVGRVLERMLNGDDETVGW